MADQIPDCSDSGNFFHGQIAIQHININPDYMPLSVSFVCNFLSVKEKPHGTGQNKADKRIYRKDVKAHIC